MDATEIGVAVGSGLGAAIVAVLVALPTIKKTINAQTQDATDRIATGVREAIVRPRVNGFLEALLRSLPYPAWVKVVERTDRGVEFRMQMVNAEYEREFQVRDPDYRDKTDFEVWPRDVAEAYYAHDSIVLNTQGNARFVEPVRSPRDATENREAHRREFEKQWIKQGETEAIVGFMRPPLLTDAQFIELQGKRAGKEDEA